MKYADRRLIFRRLSALFGEVAVSYCFLRAGRSECAPWGALWRNVFGVVPIMRLNSRVK